MKIRFSIACLILISQQVFAQKNIDTSKSIIYRIMPSAENYIDSFIRVNIKGRTPFLVIEPRVIEGESKWLTYVLHIRYYPYPQNHTKFSTLMMPIIKRTNRYMQIGRRYVPVVIQDIDQVFVFEGMNKERLPGIEEFPQSIFENGWDIIIDVSYKRWKLWDNKNW